MKTLIWIAVGLLIILHQDYWQWSDARLVWGFLPRSLAYHSTLAMATACVWLLATRWCWPQHADFAETDSVEETVQE